MEARLKQAYNQEILFQEKMLKNLQRWLRNTIVFSSLAFLLIIYGNMMHPVFKVIGVILVIICVILCAIIGLAFRNGKRNLDKVIAQKEDKLQG